MHNWSTDTTELKKNPTRYAIWKLEQQINYGLERGEKISKKLLIKYFNDINIDEPSRKFLKSIL